MLQVGKTEVVFQKPVKTEVLNFQLTEFGPQGCIDFPFLDCSYLEATVLDLMDSSSGSLLWNVCFLELPRIGKFVLFLTFLTCCMLWALVVLRWTRCFGCIIEVSSLFDHCTRFFHVKTIFLSIGNAFGWVRCLPKLFVSLICLSWESLDYGKLVEAWVHCYGLVQYV